MFRSASKEGGQQPKQQHARGEDPSPVPAPCGWVDSSRPQWTLDLAAPRFLRVVREIEIRTSRRCRERLDVVDGLRVPVPSRERLRDRWRFVAPLVWNLTDGVR